MNWKTIRDEKCKWMYILDQTFFLIHYIGFGSTKDNNDDLPLQSLALPDLIARTEHITIYKSCC